MKQGGHPAAFSLFQSTPRSCGCLTARTSCCIANRQVFHRAFLLHNVTRRVLSSCYSCWGASVMASALKRLEVLLLVAVVIAMAGCGPSATQGRSTNAISKKAVPDHIKGLRNERADVRREAAHALWQIGSEAAEATPVLLEVLHDKDPEVRAEVARALGRTTKDEKQTIPALVAATKDEEPKVRLRATVSLRDLVELAR